jgi:hypothetical protein
LRERTRKDGSGRRIWYFHTLIRGKEPEQRMLTRTQIRSAPSKNMATKVVAAKGSAKTAAATSSAAKRPSAAHNLWRHMTWGLATVAALGLAAFSSQDDAAAQKVAALLASFSAPPSPPARQFDPEAAARQLAQGVRTLADDRDRLAARLNTLEHDMRDMGGATKQQIEAAKAEAIKIAKQAPPWPDSAPPVPMTLADVAVMVKRVSPAPAEAADAPAATPAADPTPPETTASIEQPYGVDLGAAATMKSLHRRWASLRAAHPQMFDGVQPVVSLKQNPRTGRTELHLVIGPYANAQTASQFCDFVVPFRLNCQPTMFDGSRLAEQ